MPGNPPVDVQTHGQSIWYDNIQRSLLQSGGLKQLIDDYGVLGVTSNPSIFQKAIGESEDYDVGMMRLLDLEAYDIYENLAIEDIQRAADLLAGVYERTGGRDGYVSLEVSPLIANDTETTVAEAQRLFAAVDRPNTMIKIPATAAGIPAIEETIAAGINVNVTLIFAVHNYLEVAEAYIRGLERRLEAGEDVTQIASVASFFLSRIDTIVDRMLENNIRAAQGRDLDRVAANRKLLGKAAIANAKLAYKRFRDLFYGERFARLREAGAHVQRPLWASTSTKNPAYPDTMYVDGLIAKDTVNTVPPKTLMQFADHGKTDRLMTEDLEQAEETLDMLAEVGVDLDQITHTLQVDGVEAFADAFENLLAQVDAKRNVLRTGIIRQQELVLSIYADSIREAIDDLDHRFINTRIWEKDGTVWKTQNPVIQQIKERLGWLDVSQTIDRARLKALQTKAADWSHVVLLGIGSNTLIANVFAESFDAQAGYPTLHVLDTTDVAGIRAVETAIELPKTLFVVASKSGTTVETQALFNYFYDRTSSNGQQFLAITDPGTPLAQQAEQNDFYDLFLNPPDVMGVYTPLTYFGLVPAALMGLDLDALWSSAENMMMACGPKVAGIDHPGIWLGAIMGVLAAEGRDKISIFASPSIEGLSGWLEQVIAETTGKEERGLIPVVGATIGNPHDYVTDRLFIYLRVEGDDNEALDQGLTALQQASQPSVTLHLPDRYAVAGEFFRWQYATAITANLLNVNPFDAPDVEQSKQSTVNLLAHYTGHGSLPELKPALSEGGVHLYADEKILRVLSELSIEQEYSSTDLIGLLASQINSTRAGDYFVLLNYLPHTPVVRESLDNIRRRLRHTTHRAVIVGDGPGYLHSTGQLHKGGPNNGIFFLVTAEAQPDLPIPGQPYTFNTLTLAEALGDLEALQARRRRVLRLHVSGDPAAGLEKILDAIDCVSERRH
ncbi:MAG: transaldolase [Anaerolineaceae bacterium]|nr:transaldolase [Anaerolineaceae bacterium]